MAEVASAYVSLIPSLRGGASAIQKQTGPAADRAGRDAGKRFGSSMSRSAGPSLKQLITTAGGVAGALGVGKILKFGLDIASQNEQATISFTTMLGSAKRAESFIKHLQAFAAKTPFDFPGLQQAASSLISIGVKAKDVIPIMTTLGNVTSGMGTGAEGIQRATVALQQMIAADAIHAEDLNQLRDAGIPVYDLLAKSTGKSKKEVVALAQAGKLGHKELEQMLDALKSGKGLERFNGLMDKQSESLAGLASTFKDTFGQNLAAAIKPLLPLLKDGLGKTSVFLAEEMPKASRAIQDFVAEMQDGTGAGGDFVDVLGEARDIGKGVLSFFNAIPGPVKKYGVELAIAAVALNKVNNGLRSGRASVTGWLDSLGPAEKKLTATGKASYALGVGIRNVAGAGGMLAMVKGSKESNRALGALETTAGAAATGFAVGGPLGAGIGAAAGGLFSLYKAATDSGKALKTELPTLKQYADTLDGVGAATSRATRELVLEQLTKEGTLRQTRELNISDRDAVQAALGNEAARKRVTAALTKNTEAGHNYQSLNIANRLGVETTAIYSSRVAQLKKNLALAATKEEAQKIQAKLDKLARTNATARIQIGGADTAIRKLNAVLTLMHEISSSKGGNAQLPSPGSLLGQLSGRATGGPVTAGTPYKVGERGPELFVPRVDGTIIPKVPMSGGGSAVDQEQTTYRAFSRALANTGVVVMSRRNLDELDLLVGAG